MTKTPFHQQACHSAATIVGAAVGAFGGPLGVLVGAAVGYMYGNDICGIESIDRTFKNLLDFESSIDTVSANSDAQNKIISALVANGVVENEDSGATLIHYIVQEVRKNPKKYFEEFKKNRYGPATGRAQHGLAILGNKSNEATRAIKSIAKG